MAPPLHKAAKVGDVAAIHRLVGAGADVNTLDPESHDCTPLHFAVSYGHAGAIRALLGAGAAVGNVNKHGWTPLHYAAQNGHLGAISALVGAGAAVNSVTKLGNTPLHFAAYNGHPDAILALVRAGAAVGSVTKLGNTPLHLAAYNGHAGAIRALVGAGASPLWKNKEGCTPLEIAKSRDQARASRALQEAAAEAEQKWHEAEAAAAKAAAAIQLQQEAEEAAAKAAAVVQLQQEAEAAAAAKQRQRDAQAAAAAESRLPAAVCREVEWPQVRQQLEEEARQQRQQLASLQEEVARLRASAAQARPDLDSAQGGTKPGEGEATAKGTGVGTAMNNPTYSVGPPVPMQPRAAGTNFNTPVFSVSPVKPSTPPALPSLLEAGLPSCEVAESEVVLVEKLGQESFGEVWRGQWFGSDVAVKKLKADGVGELSAEVLASLRQESALMASLRHDRIVGLRGVCFDPPLIVMELCGRQALDTVLQAAQSDLLAAQKLTWPRRLGILVDVAWGMTYLHSRHVLHRDLKSPNILVDDNWRAKVADFNLSKLMEIRVGSAAASSRARSTYSSINPRWLAPELVLEGDDGTHAHATPSSDCFAFGLVMWEVLAWQYPWAELNETQIVGRLYQHRRPPIPGRSQLPGPNSGSWVGLDSFISLMQRCWDDEPAARPSFITVATELQALLG